MFPKRSVCISLRIFLNAQFVTLFSSVQWQEKPTQMQSIAPQKQVGELCDQICGTIYQLHSVLNLLWLT